MPILQQIKNKAADLIDQRLLRRGRVLDVRKWPGTCLVEIDLHLPGFDFSGWTEVPAIKFSVAPFTFRDYTPFAWDAETCTCSLIIDCGHEGPGSDWAGKLLSGDQVHYLKAESTRQAPHPTNLVVAIGDRSGLAHLLAMEQLTLPAIRFDGALLNSDIATGALLREYFGSRLQVLPDPEETGRWLSARAYCTAHTSFYLVGNHHLVSGIRRQLRSLGHQQIRVKGFWS